MGGEGEGYPLIPWLNRSLTGLITRCSIARKWSLAVRIQLIRAFCLKKMLFFFLFDIFFFLFFKSFLAGVRLPSGVVLVSAVNVVGQRYGVYAPSV